MSSKTAYDQGVSAALEKFALLQGGGVMRAAAPNVSKQMAAKKMTYAPAAGHMAPGQAAATAAANPATAAKTPGVMGRAWNGLTSIAAHPVGQIGLMMGLPMVADRMTRSDPER